MAKDLLRFLRIRDWYFYLVLPLLSCELNASAPLRFAVAAAVAACCLAFAYGWNNLQDAGLDRSQRKNPLAGTSGPRPKGPVRVLVVLTALALAGSAWLGPIPAAAAVVQLVGSALYSGGPRLKRLPVVGTLTNLLIFAPLALLCQGPGPLAPSLGGFLALFGLVLIQNQLIHEVMDQEEDQADGVRTTAQLLGRKPTMVVSGILGMAASGATVFMGVQGGLHLSFIGAALPITIFSLTTLVRPGRGEARSLRRIQRMAGMMTCGLAWVIHVLSPWMVG